MPGRRLPPQILAYLGPCRAPETDADRVVEQCQMSKLMDDYPLSDYDPLIVVMHLVAEEVRGLGLSLKGPKGSKVWIEAMAYFQADSSSLEHNTRIPCRYCNHAFEPTIDTKLLRLYLVWEESRDDSDFLSIHRCPGCGGSIQPANTVETYDGDMHTYEPVWDGSDKVWIDQILMRSGLRYG